MYSPPLLESNCQFNFWSWLSLKLFADQQANIRNSHLLQKFQSKFSHSFSQTEKHLNEFSVLYSSFGVVLTFAKAKKKGAQTGLPFFELSIMILSDHKFLCNHAFGGVYFGEITESWFLHKLHECPDYCEFCGWEREWRRWCSRCRLNTMGLKYKKAW